MQALFWASLSLFLAALLLGLAWCAFTGLRIWRALRHGLGGLMHATETLLGDAEQLAQRGERLAGRSEQLLDAVSRLRRTIARARVLVAAWGEVASLLDLLRRLVPAK